MKNMIDVLASTTDTTGTIRASDIKAAFLYIATPYDTKIDLELIAYAKQNNILPKTQKKYDLHKAIV